MRTPSNKLAAAIARQTPDEGIYATQVPGLTLHRQHHPTQPANLVYEPRICVVAQGAKRVVLGEETYVYDAKHYLISSVHLPAVAQITTATKDNTSWVTLQGTSESEIEQQIKRIYERHKTKEMDIGTLRAELTELNPNLDASIKKSGVTRFNVYLNRMIKSVEVSGSTVTMLDTPRK